MCLSFLRRSKNWVTKKQKERKSYPIITLKYEILRSVLTIHPPNKDVEVALGIEPVSIHS